MRLRKTQEFHLPTARTNRFNNTAVRSAIKYLNSLDSTKAMRQGLAANTASKILREESDLLASNMFDREEQILIELDL